MSPWSLRFTQALQDASEEVALFASFSLQEFLQRIPHLAPDAPTQKLAESLTAVSSLSRLPTLMQAWKLSLLHNLQRPSPRVRCVSLSILFLQIKQGLEYPVDCIQRVALLLSDSLPEVGARISSHRRRADWRRPRWSM